jgi:hypothetical protein
MPLQPGDKTWSLEVPSQFGVDRLDQVGRRLCPKRFSRPDTFPAMPLAGVECAAGNLERKGIQSENEGRSGN